MKRTLISFILSTLIVSGYTQIPENLPNLFLSQSDVIITDLSQWKDVRREEILNLFKQEVYGQFPDNFKPRVEFIMEETSPEALGGQAIRKQVTIRIIEAANGKTLEAGLLIYLPAESAGPVPLFLGLNFYGNSTIHPDSTIFITQSWVRNNDEYHIFDNSADERSRGVKFSRWPVEYILSRGYGVATIYCGDLDPDRDDGFKNGLHGLFPLDGTDYPANGAGTISAWAYGLYKAMDYFESDPEINHEQVILIGHSRLGKAALWAGASDQRFSMVISNNSGCGGAALSMRKHGETVRMINDVFPHWFCRNYRKYNDREELLPVDQHMLLALMAPRPLYVASALEDNWADPYGEQLSTWLASAVYSLYGLETQITEKPAIVNNPVKEGFVGYHIRSGKHDITGYDWEQYLDFADFHLKYPK